MQNMTILEKKLCAKKEKQAPEICAELIRKATVGDRDALTDLYQLSYQELYRSIRAMVRDEDLALDIEQDTYLKAFSSLHQLRSPEAFFPWLRQIAVNRAKELLRKRQPILFTDLTPEDADQPMEIADQSPYASPEMQLEAKEVQRQVREILDDLPAGQRMIAAMYFYEGMNSREIAAQLGVNPATVRVQIHNGKKSIEKRVRALEAKGVKLFGLSPIPFLVALLHRLQPAVREKRKDLEDILAKAAPEGAAAVTAVTAGSAFLHSLGIKLVAVAVAASLLVGGKLLFDYAKDGRLPWIGEERIAVATEVPDAEETEEQMASEPKDAEPDVETPETDHDREAPMTEPPEETDPAESDPKEPDREENNPEEPAQTENNPEEPAPTENNPGEPAPTENNPEEPAPTESNPANLDPDGPDQDQPEPANLDPDDPDQPNEDPSAAVQPQDPNGTEESPGPSEDSGQPRETEPTEPEPTETEPIEPNPTETETEPTETDSTEPEPTEIIASGTCGDNLTWSLDDGGLLAITGSGEMTNFWGGRPWSSYDRSITSVSLPDGLTSIGAHAFESYNLTSITIPNSITTIGESAFEGSFLPFSFVIPNNVIKIGSYAFWDCSLSSITIPSSVTDIDLCAFQGSSPSRISVDEQNKYYSSDAFSVLLNKDKTELIYCTEAYSGAYTIPDSVTVIGAYAFFDCYNLTNIVIPNSVTLIGENAFAECGSLTSVVIPNSVTTLGWYAFAGCSSLTSIVIPGSVPSVKMNDFFCCDSLTSVVIQNGVKSIHGSAFHNCRSLTDVTIPDSVTLIGSLAFQDCRSLTSVTIPAGVKTIQEYALGYLSQSGSAVPLAGFTIRGAAGSAAEQYATKNGFAFEAIP